MLAKRELEASVDALPHPGQVLLLAAGGEPAVGGLQIPELADGGPEAVHPGPQQGAQLNDLRVPDFFVMVGVVRVPMLAQQPQLFQRAVLLDPVLFTPAMIGVMALSDVVGLYRRNSMASKARSRRRQWPDRQAAFAGLHGRGMFKGWRDEALQARLELAAALLCAPVNRQSGT